MILLDTNVISEMMRPRPDEHVVKWMRAYGTSPLYTSMITKAELLAGIEMMPPGHRRNATEAGAQSILAEDFSGRVFLFNDAASHHYADIAARRRKLGRPIHQNDCQIAAIAKSNGFKLATRNTPDFENCGVELVNPWHESV